MSWGSLSSRILATTITICVVLVVAGCGNDRVDDLAANPITSTTPEGGSLVRSREERAESGFSAARTVEGRPMTLSVALNLDPAFPPAPGVFLRLASASE